MSHARVWFDGTIRDRVAVSCLDHGVLFGAGFFETFRTRSGVPVRLAAHLNRLHASCERIGVTLPRSFLSADASLSRWTPVVDELLRDAGLADGVIRLSVSAGELFSGLGSGDYTAPHEWLTVRPLPPAPPAQGVCLRFLDTRRSSPEWYPRPKSLNYLNSLLSARELARIRAESSEEGLLLDANGAVCEGVVSNVFWRKDGVWFTSHEDTGCLPGIGRAHILSSMRAEGIRVEEVLAFPEDFLRADSIASVGSVRGVVPVRAVLNRDGRVLTEPAIHGVHELAQVFGA